MTQAELYKTITERMIREMEQGVIPWHKPWTGTQGGAVSGTTGRPYSILNQMLLGKSGKWYTFNQVSSIGGKVRKGEKGSFIVFWKPYEIKGQVETDENGNEFHKYIPLLKHFYVFHESQCENVPVTEPSEIYVNVPIEAAEKIEHEYSKRELIKINHIIGDRAFYSPSIDEITVPTLEQYPDRNEYYSTIYHEMIHSTGHKSRLNRINKTAAFGSADYSKEELIAEIGSAALMHSVGIETPNTFRNSTAYIQGWLKALRNDPRMLISASGQAAKAVSFVLNTNIE